MQQILEGRGFELTCRGSVDVKGKGSMITYFLKGKKPIEVKEDMAQAEIEPPKTLTLVTEPDKLTTDKEKQLEQANEDSLEQEDDLLPSPDIDMNSNMQNLTAQRRKSLCRQHNISSSFGTTVSSSTGITPSISNSSSVVTIGALPTILRSGNPNPTTTDSCSECGGASKSLATPTAPPRTLVADLKDEIARDEKIGLKDSIENLEILLKNNISLSDLSNKQQQNLRGETSSSTTTTLRKRDTIVSFNVTETVTTTATPFSSSSGSSNSSAQPKKRRSVTTIAASFTTSTTTRLLSNESQSSTQTAPGTLESSSVPGQSSTENSSQDWQPRTASLEPNRSPIKTSQSMSPIGQLTTDVFVLPNSRSMVLISSTNGSVSGMGTGGGGSSPRTGLLQDVST